MVNFKPVLKKNHLHIYSEFIIRKNKNENEQYRFNRRLKKRTRTKYQKDITSRIKLLASRNTKTLDITKFTGDDPILEVMNTLKDSDEIVIDDVAYMLGITRSTLLKRIDHSNIREVNLTPKDSTLLLSVGYIKELLATYNKADKEKRKFVQKFLKYHYKNSFDISLRRQMRFYKSLPFKNPEYDRMNLRVLILDGYNRGLVKSRAFNSMIRMMNSFNAKLLIDTDYNTATTAVKRKGKHFITVYTD